MGSGFIPESRQGIALLATKRKKRALFATTLAIAAVAGGLAFSSGSAFADSTLPLGNPGATPEDFTTGEGSCSGLDAALNYWHFVVVPNSGAGSFLSITLVLNNGSGNTSFTFTGAQIVPNGSQTDNVFVAIPAGYALDDIVSGSAVISGTGSKFNLSHTCTAGRTPLTASKTAVASYDTNVHWELTKTVDPTSHSGAAGEIAGDSDWTITATKVQDADSDFKVSGTITVNNANTVAVPFSVTDALNDGTLPGVNCPASVPANDSVTCTYSATPTTANATLNTATIASGLAGVGGAVATAPVIWTVEDANGDDTVQLTDPYLGLDEATSSTIVEVINEQFPCSSNGADYTNGSYSYDVPNTAFLDGDNTALSASASVHVDCTLPALSVYKTAEGSFDRHVSWTLDKSVDIPSFTGTPGSVFNDIWNIDVTRTVSDPENFAVRGQVTIINDASIDQPFTADDLLDSGDLINLDCGGAIAVPAHDSVVCTYDQAVADGSATLNTVTVTAAGNDPVQATAPVDFAFTGFTGDVTTDLTDARLPIFDHPLLAAAILLNAPEQFTCAAADSPLYVNGTYTYTETNTANLDGVETHLTDSASVTVTCNQRKVTGGHTIGYWFNAPAGNAQTLAARATLLATYPKILAGVDLSTANKIKAFGNNANCSGTCTTMLQAQFIATAMSVLKDVNDYGDQCVAVPTYIDADGVAQIDDLLVAINAGFPWSLARTIELKTVLDGINNDLPFNLC